VTSKGFSSETFKEEYDSIPGMGQQLQGLILLTTQRNDKHAVEDVNWAWASPHSFSYDVYNDYFKFYVAWFLNII